MSPRSPEGGSEVQHGPEDFGNHVHLTVMFRRHEEPGKTPEGMSADFLTEKGVAGAKGRGKEVQAPVAKGFGSKSVERARETVAYLLENVDEGVEVLNQRLTEERKAHDVKAARYTAPEGKEPLVMRAKSELNPVPNLGKVWTGLMEKAKQLKAEGDARDTQDIAFQLYLDLPPEQLTEKGIPTQEETAAELAYLLERAVDMSGRLLDNSDVQLEMGTHGPKLEPFLREVAMMQDEESGSRTLKRGFKDLSEIGGSTKPGEGIEVVIDRTSKEEANVTLTFHGKKFLVDMERVRELADLHRQKKKAQKEKAA